MYWLAILALPSLFLALRPGASPSRRLLACAIGVLVPIAGPFLAVLVRRVRGGAIAPEPPPDEPVRRMSPGDAAHLGELPPILDRLLAGDPSERLEALVALSSAGDASAVAVLRWAIEHGPPEVVLDAALTLEEIELRAEARVAAARERLGTTRNVELALAAAEAAAAPLRSRIADPAIAPVLAEQARGCYQLALEWAPERSFEILEKLARLELAAGRPRAALELLDRLMSNDGEDLARIAQLRDHAAFAARVFDVMSFTPLPLETPVRLAACKLQTVPT